MDPIEGFYRKNKEQFDQLELSDHLWESLEKKLPRQSRPFRSRGTFLWIGGIAAMITAILVVIFQSGPAGLHSTQREGVTFNQVSPDIVLANPEGETVALSAFQGQVVLVEFWASWCNVCREKNCEELLPVYDEYKNKGFEIFAVSLDEDPYLWQESIERDRLPWVQVSDLQGFASPVSQQFGVTHTYTTFLLDADHKIIGKNLSRKELEAKLQSCFGEPL